MPRRNSASRIPSIPRLNAFAINSLLRNFVLHKGNIHKSLENILNGEHQVEFFKFKGEDCDPTDIEHQKYWRKKINDLMKIYRFYGEGIKPNHFYLKPKRRDNKFKSKQDFEKHYRQVEEFWGRNIKYLKKIERDDVIKSTLKKFNPRKEFLNSSIKRIQLGKQRHKLAMSNLEASRATARNVVDQAIVLNAITLAEIIIEHGTEEQKQKSIDFLQEKFDQYLKHAYEIIPKVISENEVEEILDIDQPGNDEDDMIEGNDSEENLDLDVINEDAHDNEEDNDSTIELEVETPRRKPVVLYRKKSGFWNEYSISIINEEGITQWNYHVKGLIMNTESFKGIIFNYRKKFNFTSGYFHIDGIRIDNNKSPSDYCINENEFIEIFFQN
jgi:hypothetical protein